MTNLNAAQVFRDYDTSGVPASGARKVSKREARALFAGYESSQNLAFTTSMIGKASRAALYSDLAHATDSLAIVMGDATAANNGYYKKSGGVGTGSWSRIADLDGPYLLTVTGGTANAIQASISPCLPAIPGSQLYILVPTAANTEAVTLAVDGGDPVALKSVFGVPLAADSLLIDVPQLLIWEVDSYRLFLPVNVDASAILAAAVAAQNAAATSASAAAAAAAGVNLPSIVSGDAGKVLQVLSDETGYELIEAAELSARTFGLKSVLTAAQWADVRDATNLLDIAGPINAAIADIAGNYPGSTIDARAWRDGATSGVTCETDLWANLHTARIKLITGEVTLKREMNSGVAGASAFRRPSLSHWDMRGTIIKPLTAITGNVASPNDSEKSMISSWLGQTTATGAFGTKTLTVDDPTGANVGALVALEGLAADTSIHHNLAGSINASDMSFTLGVAGDMLHTLGSGHCYIQIDNEIILGAVTKATGVFTVSQRGANGSTAASHTAGTPAYWVNSQVSSVVSVVDNTVTIADNLLNNCTDAVMHIGAIGHRISGHYTVDGEFDEATSDPDAFFQCMGSVLARKCIVTGRGILKRAAFGGLFEYAGRENLIRLAEISSVGRAAGPYGGGIWIFGQNNRTKVSCEKVVGTVNGVFIDDKSESEGSFGLERENNQCSVDIDFATNLANGFGISGSRDCRIRFGFLSADVAGTMNNNESQRVELLSNIRNNVVTIESDECGTGASGDILNKDGNRVIRLSNSEFLTTVVLSSTNIPANGAADVNFTVTGAEVGASVHVTPLFTPLGGIAIAYAYVVTANTVKIGFTNSTAGILAVAGSLLVAVRNG